MKKFIEDIININKEDKDNNILAEINFLKEKIEKAKKENKEAVVKFLEEELNALKNNINNINIVKDYLREIQKIDKFSSIPVKIDDNSKEKFKEIAKLLNIKQGELFGILIKYFVDNFCKENPDSKVCK